MAHDIDWSATFKNSPPTTGESPQYGALRIRATREGVEERATLEHYWASGTSDYGGKHRMGAARAFYTNAEPTLGPHGDTLGGTYDAGRIWFNSTNNNLFNLWTGGNWVSSLAINTLKINSNLNVMQTADLDSGLQVAGATSLAGTLNVAGAMSLTSPLYIEDASGHGGQTFGSGTELVHIVGDAYALKIQNYSNGDYAILNSAQNNAVVFYNAAGGIALFYNGTEVARVNSTGIQILDNDYRFSGRHFTDSFAASSTTGDAIFDALTSYLSGGETMLVSGSVAESIFIWFVSKASKSGSTITLHGLRYNSSARSVSDTSISVTNGDTTFYAYVNIAW